MERSILKTKQEVSDWFTSCPTELLKCSKMLAFDWETTGLNYMTMEPVGISFCDGKRACYINLWQNIEQQGIFGLLEHLFDVCLFIAHNAKFDIKCCRKFIGTEPIDIFDTYIASYLLDENRVTHGLKVLATQDIKVPIGEIQSWEKASQFGYDSETFQNYGMNDAIWTYQLFELYKPQIEEEGLHHVFYNIEMPFIFVLVDMEINGIKVDLDRLNKLEFDARQTLIELEDRMLAEIGERPIIQKLMFGLNDRIPELDVERILPINFRSTPQLIKVIEKKLKIQIPTSRDPKDGKYKKSLGKNTVSQLAGKHPFIDLLIDYKKVRKLYDAYIIPAFELIDSDGRIRPSFGIVKTGRTNCRTPNLQQLPNLSKRFPNLNYRSIFSAEKDDCLVGGDYSGQELRVLGEVSKDEKICHAFNAGIDLHLFTANFVFSLGLLEGEMVDGTEGHKRNVIRFESERYRAKNGVNFPIVYGSSEYGIANNMKVEVAVAKEWRNKFFKLYPGVSLAMNETKEELEENQYVTTMMGRQRRFPGYRSLPNFSKGKTPSKSRCVRQAFNFKIQGFSADQIKIASAKVRNAGLKILMIIHDEIVIESNDPQYDARTLKSCMEHAVQLSVPFIANVKTGKSYSELK
jgi:DNA polymerase-1